MNAAVVEMAPPPVDTGDEQKMPWPVYVAVTGLACLPIGLLWDISHHSTIGRDTFWTPAHIIIQLGGIVPALLFAGIALKMTFRGTEEERAASVSFWGFRAPLGVWVTIWGAMAMVTSAPFDDWWHNRYGLDVKIVSPPHAILGLGMFAVGMGVLLFVFSAQNRAKNVNLVRTGLICSLAVGVMMTLWSDFATEYTWPNLQHGSRFYAVICTPFPLLLVLAARASRVRAAATLAAAAYMLLYIAVILLLPLFPAHPKLAPIYRPLDHMLPPAFPLLLIVPAAAIDGIMWLLERRHLLMIKSLDSFQGGSPRPSDGRGVRGEGLGGGEGLRSIAGAAERGGTATAAVANRRRTWWRDWVLAAGIALVFLAIVLAVQWPFSTFLLSDAADNRFFARSGHWPYFAQPGDWMNTFWDHNTDPFTGKGVALALLRAFISTRIGLWFGSYLLRLKR